MKTDSLTYYDIIIFGAGAAVLFAVLNIKKYKKILILEKSSSVDMKILISGSGQCNFTHIGFYSL